MRFKEAVIDIERFKNITQMAMRHNFVHRSEAMLTFGSTH